MNTKEINNALRYLRNFGGVLAADQLPMIQVKGKFYIINTDPSTKPGKHWIAVYMDETPEFFDSLGQAPSTYKKEFEYFLINHGPEYIYNTQRIQNYGTDKCGEYCIYYVILRGMGFSMKQIVKRFSTVNLQYNDNTVHKFYCDIVKKFFG